MLTFLIWTIIFWYAGNCVLKVFFTAIQDGQILDTVFGWQSMLKRLYSSESIWKNNLGKALGDCQMCTSFWFMPFWFAIYYFMSVIVLHAWVTDSVNGWALKLFVSIIWYILFHSVGAIVGFARLLAIKNKKK